MDQDYSKTLKMNMYWNEIMKGFSKLLTFTKIICNSWYSVPRQIFVNSLVMINGNWYSNNLQRYFKFGSLQMFPGFYNSKKHNWIEEPGGKNTHALNLNFYKRDPIHFQDVTSYNPPIWKQINLTQDSNRRKSYEVLWVTYHTLRIEPNKWIVAFCIQIFYHGCQYKSSFCHPSNLFLFHYCS